VPKVYIVGGDVLIEKMFVSNEWSVVDNPDDAEYIQFTGGADVSPMLYGEPRHPRTGNNLRRDEEEAEVFFEYKDSKKMLGICRGGQFLNVMNGGAMYQDVNNHAIGGTHAAVISDTGRIVQVTSTHHQMMIPNHDTGRVLVHANLATRKEDGYGLDVVTKLDWLANDTEVVFYFLESQSLCFQPHPEYVNPEHECQRLYFDLINQYMKG
jgi:carbamoylphosphate synthase small subunit